MREPTRRPAAIFAAVAALLLGGICSLPAAAQAQATVLRGAPAGASWSALSPAQRQTLEPLERHWYAMDEPARQKWLEIASRYGRMPPDERARVQQRMGEWARLSPKQRHEARQNFQGVREHSAEDKQARWQAYKELPEDQRRGLAARAKADTAADTAADKRSPRTPSVPAQGKVNTVPNPPLERQGARPVTPSVVQARPGATTNLISRKPAPPLHQQPGLPKVATTPEFVDSSTFLPQRGPQGAATDPRRRP